MVRSAASSSSSSRTVVGAAGPRLQIRSMLTPSSSPNPLFRTTDLVVIKEPLDLVARFETAKAWTHHRPPSTYQHSRPPRTTGTSTSARRGLYPLSPLTLAST